MNKPFVFIIAALTADGFIGKNNSHLADWTSKEDKTFFIEISKKAGVVVMGLNTFNTMKKPLKDRVNIVYSEEKINCDGVEITSKEPKKLLEELYNRGFKEVAICGGSQIYTLFMESGLVDALYLTIEPLVFGSGISLFNKPLNKKLEFKNIKKIGDQTLMLEYTVIKEIP